MAPLGAGWQVLGPGQLPLSSLDHQPKLRTVLGQAVDTSSNPQLNA
ncbi:MAG: hypothetical protein F6K04_23285 [Leptolyngbya sp. SIO4C5]|nr:hypothetical protein [Leptolyngbya sp. SIO4C5]